MTTPRALPRDLGRTQRWMQAVLMHPTGVAEGIASAEARRHIDVGPDEAETVVTRSRALTALERLGIYGRFRCILFATIILRFGRFFRVQFEKRPKRPTTGPRRGIG